MFYKISEESLQTGEHPYDPVWIFKENCVHSKGLVAKDFSHVPPRQKNRRCPLKQTSIRSTGTPRVSTYPNRSRSHHAYNPGDASSWIWAKLSMKSHEHQSRPRCLQFERLWDLTFFQVWTKPIYSDLRTWAWKPRRVYDEVCAPRHP